MSSSDNKSPLLATVKRRHLAWYGHISRQDSLAKIILQGTVEGKQSRNPGWLFKSAKILM